MKTTLLQVAALSALCATVFLPSLGRVPIYTEGEARHAVAVRDLVAARDWAFAAPMGAGATSSRLFYWAASLAALALGHVTELAIRLPSALFATAGVVGLYLFGRTVYGPRTAGLASVMLAVSVGYQSQAIVGRADMTACAVMTLTLFVFYLVAQDRLEGPGWHAAFYLLWGATLLAGGPATFTLAAAIMGAFLVVTRQGPVLRRLGLHWGLLLTAGMILVYAATAPGATGGPDLGHAATDDRWAAGLLAHLHPRTFYYHLPKYLVLVGLPGSLLWPAVTIAWSKRAAPRGEPFPFLLVWALVTSAVFCVSPTKKLASLLPLVPPLVLLTARSAEDLDTVTATVRPLAAGAFAVFTAASAVLLLVAVAGADPAWLLAPALSLVKLEHQATVALVGQIIRDGRWPILLCSGLFVALGTLSVAHLGRGRVGRVPLLLALIFVVGSWFTHITVLPVVAQAMTYRSFAQDVRGLVTGGSDLSVWDTDVPIHQLVFYYGGRIRVLDDRPALVRTLRSADAYVIMSETSRRRLLAANVRTPAPILRTGPGSGTTLVLVRGRPNAEISSDGPGPGTPPESAARRPRLIGVDRQAR